MKTVLKKIFGLLLLLAALAGAGVASTEAGFIEARIKITVGGFSCTVDLP